MTTFLRRTSLPVAFLFALFAAACALQGTSDTDVSRWNRQAQNITIIRDNWGIPHIHGKTDADAVFGAMYAQA
ncbi:MAG TPA: penicillin acylase family protein, partial [Vicinamibacterales bacterium]|nr:penicillin acylase family protein [Vicinamibacterales bacterium]